MEKGQGLRYLECKKSCNNHSINIYSKPTKGTSSGCKYRHPYTQPKRNLRPWIATPACNASAKVVGRIWSQSLHTNINARSVPLLVLVTGFSWIISCDVASCIQFVPLFLLLRVHFNNILCNTKGVGACCCCCIESVPPLVMVRELL